MEDSKDLREIGYDADEVAEFCEDMSHFIENTFELDDELELESEGDISDNSR